MTAVSKKVVDGIRRDFLTGCRTEAKDLAAELGCHSSTVYNYRQMYRLMQQHYPDRLEDYSFNLQIKRTKKFTHELDRAHILEDLFPEIMDDYKLNRGISNAPLYAIYKTKVADPYSLKIFLARFGDWRAKYNICYYHHLRIKEIPSADLKALKMWRKYAFEAYKFKRAFAILASYGGMHMKQIATIIDKKVETVIYYLNDYRANGLQERKVYQTGAAKLEAIKTKQDNLIKLVHQSPRLFQLNRETWRLEDLQAIYLREYQEPIGRTTIRKYLHAREYGFKHSREALTSNDPKFREKLDYIKSVLSNLAPDEKFFSIDEYGHFAVKLKGGRSIMPRSKTRIVPQIQQSKGFMVITAALELSTNQVTHFYSKTKDTREMIKLIDILCRQYKGNRHLYLSWDAAVWHRSKQLREYLADINSEEHRSQYHNPIVKLAPLPTSAQFLNIIESVFSGLARAVIHNSDYASLEDCQASIDLHFADRNAHYLANPKQAGNLIWGKELVKPVFDETNNCDTKK